MSRVRALALSKALVQTTAVPLQTCTLPVTPLTSKSPCLNKASIVYGLKFRV